MDSLDRLLTQMPGETPPPDLSRRIFREIRKRRQREAALRLGSGALLSLAGLWLSLPAILTGLLGVALPDNGLLVLLRWTELALQDMERLVFENWSGLVALQSSWTQSGIYSVPGLFALGLGALVMIQHILPREEA